MYYAQIGVVSFLPATLMFLADVLFWPLIDNPILIFIPVHCYLVNVLTGIWLVFGILEWGK